MRAWLAAPVLVACGGPPPSENAPAPVPPDPPDASWSEIPAGTLPSAPGVARDLRRMDVDQLDASMRAITGGIGWDDRTDPTIDLWQDLAPTLGVPDYVTVTLEDRSTGVLFQKFLGDAAAQVCDDLVAREAAGGPDNVFLVDVDLDTTDAAAIDANLARAVLRWHGHVVAPGDPALAPWAFLYGSTLIATDDPVVAWQTVCVGLFVHPDFYGY